MHSFDFSRIDHLIFGVPELQAGLELIEQKLGIKLSNGGQHPAFGTHNALFRLSEHTYFEVIAPDPSLAGQRLWMGLDQIDQPGLIWWAVKVSGLEQASRAAAAVGWELGVPMEGSRITAAGSRLQWQLTDPYRKHPGGVLPFLIDWGAGAHPCDDLPIVDCRLTNVELLHPQPEKIAHYLNAIQLEIKVTQRATPGIRASFLTHGNKVTLT